MISNLNLVFFVRFNRKIGISSYVSDLKSTGFILIDVLLLWLTFSGDLWMYTFPDIAATYIYRFYFLEF